MRSTVKEVNHKRSAILINLIIIMVLLGISDSLRGVFIPIFQTNFQLDTKQASLIITVSYIGNLLFLLYGGHFVDKYKKKPVMLVILGIWMMALVIFISTNNYYWLLIGMFFSMGASTLMSTTINIIVPVLFVSTPGLIMNVLGFTQGVGTSGSQNLIGKYAQQFTAWKSINMGLLLVGVAAFIGLIFVNLPESKTPKKTGKEKANYKQCFANPAFLYLVFIFGFYFIAEHGILNWLVAYANAGLGYSISQSSMYLSIFFMGITIGRLVLSPLVDRLGVFRSISIFASIGGVLYITGALLGKDFIMLLSLSGLCFSIIYPTLVLMIRKFYKADNIATATGIIISIATLFDIGFNMLFGIVTDYIGFKASFLVLPLSMVAFCLCYFVFIKRIPVAMEA